MPAGDDTSVLWVWKLSGDQNVNEHTQPGPLRWCAKPTADWLMVGATSGRLACKGWRSERAHRRRGTGGGVCANSLANFLVYPFGGGVRLGTANTSS